jgi:uncharacterized cofD-like protein
LPHLLVRGVSEAIAASPAVKVFICNIMTQANETLGFTAADHLRAVLAHSPVPLFDSVLVNSAAIPDEVASRYADQGAEPVTCDVPELASLGVTVVPGDFVTDTGVARHNPHRLAAELLRLAVEYRTARTTLPAAA